jgi:Thioredoxin domain
MAQPLRPPFVLCVFVSGHCALTEHVTRVTAEVRRELPFVVVKIVDVETTREPLPDAVFSVPTYTINGRVISLGNPDVQFVAELRALFERECSCKIQS